MAEGGQEGAEAGFEVVLIYDACKLSNMTSDQLEKVLEQIHEWIRSADQKVSILLAFEGVFILAFIEKIANGLTAALNVPSCCLIFLYLLVFLFLILSIWKSIQTITPRLKHEHKKKSPIYFGDIAQISIESYQEKISTLSSADYSQELVKQIHTCSCIASKKHTAFRDALILLFISFGIFALIEICQKNPIS